VGVALTAPAQVQTDSSARASAIAELIDEDTVQVSVIVTCPFGAVVLESFV
jgi:hypothetical protein